MSDPHPQESSNAPQATPQSGNVHGVMGEFDDVDSLLSACRRVRDAGYTKTDAYTPFPVHGIDSALGIKPTVLPWIALVCGVTGTLTALAMQIWMNGIDYKYIISGKPYISLPAFMPVAFELTILFASFGTFFGMWALNKLPKFSDPIFTDPRFDRATDDKFFLYIDAKDDKFDRGEVEGLLGETSNGYVAPVMDDGSSTQVPRFIFMTWMLVIGLSSIPLLVALKIRLTRSDLPRFHVFFDMDFSPAKDAQQNTTLFADARTMRPDVAGTVYRGQPNLDVLTGVDMAELARINPSKAARLVAIYSGDEASSAGESAADDAVKSAEAKKSAVEEVKTDAGSADASESQSKSSGGSGDKPKEPKNGGDKDSGDGSDGKSDGEKNSSKAESDKSESESKPEMSDQEDAEENAAATSPATREPAMEDRASDILRDDQNRLKPAQAEGISGTGASMPEDNAQTGESDVAQDNTPWLNEIPVPVTADLVYRGQQQFNIYCAVCHGRNGAGKGLVHQRAQKILASNWIPPSSLHDPLLYSDKYAEGKLFSTISNGIRKMPGYASQIKVEDRWAIVAYVRALQTSRQASEDMLPAKRREKILTEKSEIEKRLKEEAEKEQAAAAEKST